MATLNGRFWQIPFRKQNRKSQPKLRLDAFEERITPYSVSGNSWPTAQKITVSFMPDGTSVNGKSSNLFATFNAKFGSATTWQNVFKEAAQVWAAQTNVNFSFVTDNGAASGSGSYQQGDPNYGDIRIGGYNFGTTTLAQAFMPPPVNNYSIAGDIAMNTGQTFNIGSTFDLFTVASHEIGHALGLNHGNVGSIMSSAYPGTLAALQTDDINGIRAIYSGGAVRSKDTYDTAAANDSFATATLITSTINTTTKTAVINNLDLSTSADADWYKFVIPAGSATTLKVKAVATGISMLDPKIDIYKSSNTLMATGNGAAYGSIASAQYTGIAAAQTWYVKVSSIDAKAAFKTGRYSLILNMGTGADPTVTYTNSTLANGSPLSSGGGVAIGDGIETQLNLLPAGSMATTYSAGPPKVSMNESGSFVSVWSATGLDGGGAGIFGQRFDTSGAPVGGVFQINTTTTGDQLTPAVAIANDGTFVVTWASVGQDGSGSGIYAQRYFANGGKNGAEFRVNSTTAGDQVTPSVGVDGSGDTFFAWTSYGQDNGTSAGIYSQFFDATGTPIGGETRVNSTTAGDQVNPVVSVNNNATNGSAINFVIGWSSYNQDAANSWGAYGQRYTSSGSKTGSEFLINTTTAGDQKLTGGTVGNLGGFTPVWTSVGQDGNLGGIYSKRYGNGGTVSNPEFQVNTTTGGDQSNATVTNDKYGNLAYFWQSASQDGSGYGIYGQQYSNTLAAINSEFRVNTSIVGDQANPIAKMDSLGHLIVLWNGPTTPGVGVFLQRYSVNTSAEIPPVGDVFEPYGCLGNRPPKGFFGGNPGDKPALISSNLSIPPSDDASGETDDFSEDVRSNASAKSKENEVSVPLIDAGSSDAPATQSVAVVQDDGTSVLTVDVSLDLMIE